jgi:hypothetical protein
LVGLIDSDDCKPNVPENASESSTIRVTGIRFDESNGAVKPENSLCPIDAEYVNTVVESDKSEA